MTDSPILAAARRDAVAAQLARRVRWLAPDFQARDLRMGESFPVFTLRAHDVALGHRIRRLHNRVRATGRWYHQIRAGGKAVFVAQSGPDDEGGWTVLNVFGAALAAHIGAAIAGIDRDLPEAGLARILLVPERQAIFFWIEQPGADRLVPVSAESLPSLSSPGRPATVHLMLTRLFGDYREKAQPLRVRRPPRRSRLPRRRASAPVPSSS
jgi:hypothetical protein